MNASSPLIAWHHGILPVRRAMSSDEIAEATDIVDAIESEPAPRLSVNHRRTLLGAARTPGRRFPSPYRIHTVSSGTEEISVRCALDWDMEAHDLVATLIATARATITAEERPGHRIEHLSAERVFTANDMYEAIAGTPDGGRTPESMRTVERTALGPATIAIHCYGLSEAACRTVDDGEPGVIDVKLGNDEIFDVQHRSIWISPLERQDEYQEIGAMERLRILAARRAS